jgi:hypothetical protein
MLDIFLCLSFISLCGVVLCFVDSWCGNNVIVTCSRDGLCKVWTIKETTTDTCSNYSNDTTSNGTTGIQSTMECVLEFKPYDGASVTTVDAMLLARFDTSSTSAHRPEVYTLAIGAESGDIKLWQLTVEYAGAALSSYGCVPIHSVQCTEALVFPSTICHGSTVKRLRWRNQYSDADIYDHTVPLSSSSRSGSADGASNSSYADKSNAREYLLASCGEDFGVRVFSVKI